jgi:hypothetical protein
VRVVFLPALRALHDFATVLVILDHSAFQQECIAVVLFHLATPLQLPYGHLHFQVLSGYALLCI